jgi:hypothetical protein
MFQPVAEYELESKVGMDRLLIEMEIDVTEKGFTTTNGLSLAGSYEVTHTHTHISLF